MSTTAAAGSRSAPSSLAASTRFGRFAKTFSITGPVIYCAIQYLNWPLFTFHPATDRIVWGYEAARSGEGPNMLWYGWSATTILIAAALGIVAMALPAHVTRRIPLSLVWIFPILTIPYIVYSLMPWWTLAAK